MLSFSEKIKNEAIDNFDNFIIQAVAPSPDEIKGIFEHNRSVEWVEPDSLLFHRPQPNRQRVPWVVLQSVQSFSDFGSRVDGKVFAVQQLLDSDWLSPPAALSYRINVEHLEENEIRWQVYYVRNEFLLQRSHFAWEPQKHFDADRQLVLEAKHGAESAESVTSTDDEELATAMAAWWQKENGEAATDANSRCLSSAAPPTAVSVFNLDADDRRRFLRSKLSVFEFLLQAHATQLASKLYAFQIC